MASQNHLDGLLQQVRCSNIPRVKNDIIAVQRRHANLVAKTATHTSDDGASAVMVMLEGTVTIRYKGSPYNIPVEVFVREPYPAAAPLCFVRPVPGMALHKGHKHVGLDGTCYLNALAKWNGGSSNLVNVTEEMVEVFSAAPPLFTIPRTAQQQQPPREPLLLQALSQGQSSQPQSPPPVYPSGYPSGTRGAVSASATTSSSGAGSSSAGSGAAAEAASGDPRRASLLSTVTGKVQRHLKGVFEAARGETEEQYRLHKVLGEAGRAEEQREKALGGHVASLRGAVSVAEAQLAALDACLQAAALSDGDAAAAAAMAVVPAPADALSAKMLEMVAEAAAVEDTLYALDKALAEGAIELDPFMKQVRTLAKQQFFATAHAQKIGRAQRHLAGPEASAAAGAAAAAAASVRGAGPPLFQPPPPPAAASVGKWPREDFVQVAHPGVGGDGGGGGPVRYPTAAELGARGRSS